MQYSARLRAVIEIISSTYCIIDHPIDRCRATTYTCCGLLSNQHTFQTRKRRYSMSFNIVDLVKDQISDQLLGQMGNMLGDESSKISDAMGSALPGLLSGLTGASGSAAGADKLFKVAQDQDEGMLGNMGALLGGSNAASVVDGGTSMLTNVLGGSGLGKLAGVIAGFAGLSKGGSSSLLGMLAPIVISVLKRKIMGDGMNAGSLANMLMGQKDNIANAMPTGFSDQLSSSGFLSSLSDTASSTISSAVGGAGTAASNTLGNIKDTAESTVSEVRDSASSGGSSMLRWLLPLAGVVLLGWLGMKFLAGDKDGVSDAVDASTNAVTESATTATEAATSAVESVSEDVTDSLTGEAAELGDSLTTMFSGATETFGNITDVDSAKAAIPALTDLGGSLGETKTLFDKVPSAARGPLTSIINTGLSALQPIIDKVMAIPGIGPVLEPVVGPILESLQSMQG